MQQGFFLARKLHTTGMLPMMGSAMPMYENVSVCFISCSYFLVAKLSEAFLATINL